MTHAHFRSIAKDRGKFGDHGANRRPQIDAATGRPHSRPARATCLIFATCTALATSVFPAGAQYDTPQWDTVSPGTTGLPGEEVRTAALGPDGRIWVGARHPFWSDGGIGVYDPGTNSWEVHSNVPNSLTIDFPSALVNQIAFSPDGSVWAATNDGLAHLVGGAWTLYTTGNAPFQHNEIESVAVDPSGAVWVNNTRLNFTDGALHRFDGTTWTTWRGGAGLPWPSITPLRGPAIDPATGHVWVAAFLHSGLAEWDGSAWSLHPTVDGFGQEVANLKPKFVDPQGDLWLVGAPIIRYRNDTLEFFGASNTPFTNNEVMGIALDSSGRVWASNVIGQVIQQSASGGSTWSLRYFNNGVWVNNVLPRPGGDFWLWHSGVNLDTGYLKHITADGTRLAWLNRFNTGMPDYFVSKIDLDRSGALWIATGEGGISRFDGTRWRNWGNHNKGSEPYPWAGNEPMGSFYLDQAGVGWMGGNGIGRWVPGTGQFSGFWNWQNNPPMGVTIFRHFTEDMNGTVFGASEDAWIYRFNGTNWDIDQYNAHFGLHRDSAGNVYSIGGLPIEGETLARRWDGTAWSNVNLGIDLNDLGPTCMAIGPDDVFWIGTNDGLVRSQNGLAQVWKVANSPLPARRIEGIDVREDGLVALACDDLSGQPPYPNGVCVISGSPSLPANWHVYRYGTHPIPHYQLGDVEFDGQGRLWISAISEACAVAEFSAPVGVDGVESGPTPGEGGDGEFSLYPNPVPQQRPIRFHLEAAASGPITFSLHDISGRELGRITQSTASGAGEIVIEDLVTGAPLPGGVYLLQARGTDGLYGTKRVTILR
ncbi:MAG: hypothetical protein IPK72_16840 [Candidatus Eisenbacteria bacterium]|nr:hypothetical protein [Candidatus Eisenbacteria bacterium]